MERRVAPPRPSATLPGKDLGDEYVFYDRDRDRVHILNGTARRIYLLCDGSRTMPEIGREMARLFSIDEDHARRDVEEMVESLVRIGILAR